MSDRSNREYRRSSSRKPSNEPKFNGGFVTIMVLQIFLCTLLVLGSVGIKYLGDNMYSDFKQTYNDIMDESLTGQKINTWAEKAENWIAQAMNIFGKPLETDSNKDPNNNNEEKNIDNQSQSIETENMGRGGELPISSVYEKIDGVNMEQVVVTGDFIFPVKDINITSIYGYRKHPISGELDFHTGLDFAAEQGTDIVAVKDGIVKEVGKSDTYGNYISIMHDSGLETFYAHCEKVVAKENKTVKMGDVIAKVGSTGVSTGYHLHLETRSNGIKFDPNCIYKLELANEE